MGAVVEYVKKIWPFSAFVYDDLRASDRIVRKLPIPESTKHFVYAIREPETGSVIYMLCVQNLSERSAFDAECLIRELKPDAVIVQVGRLSNYDISELQKGGNELVKNSENGDEYVVPTSSFGVLKECFMRKINREKYEDVAGDLVLREIFGVSFNGHLIAAKKAAEEVGASFFMLDSPFVKCSTSEDDECSLDSDMEVGKLESRFQNALGMQLPSLATLRIGSLVVPMNTRAFYVADGVQSQAVKSLSSSLFHLNPVAKFWTEDIRLVVNYEVPQFAKSVYPLLFDLHDVFVDIPSMRKALACAQKMLSDVNNGEKIDSRLLSEIYVFQIAVEGLRIAFNNAGRLSMNKMKTSAISNCEFSELPVEDKSHVILAHALQSQTRKYRSIVAVVDASGLAGLRKQWNTTLPSDVKDMVEQLVTSFGNDTDLTIHRKRLLADNPVVAVGAGATAILGASSLSKAIPISTFFKIATLYVPAWIQVMLSQTQKAVLLAIGKALGPTKIVVPGMASSTMKSSVMKAAASAEKIRAVAHGVITSAEKTSLSATRTAFYEIMRKRRIKPVGILPWLTFGGSIATCTGLLVYGDGIECAAESFPAAPSIASLGRGIQSLHQASQAVRHTESSRIQNSIETLLHKFKKIKIQ